MKRTVTFLLLLLIAAVSAPFFIAGPDGRPIARLDDIGLPPLSLPHFTLPTWLGGSRASSNKVTFYRWTDAQGGVQMSNHPPPAGTSFDTVRVDPDANIMAAPVSRPKPSAPAVDSPTPGGSSSALLPGGAGKLLQDAKGVQQQVDQYKAAQDGALK